MDFVQGYELGRESVNSVNAGVLATVLRELVGRYQQLKKVKHQVCDVQLRCSDSLDIRRRKPRKIGEDEGFESDEDARSVASSCCLVEDHVFKVRKAEKLNDRASPSGTSISASTDSANSSGSSDTDETESPPVSRPNIESFPIADVIFCHTEARHPNTIAWVIKKKNSYFDTTSRLGKTGIENLANDSCLDVIVIKCRSSEDFKILCDNYRDRSRRMKLDQYKSINRKKPIVLSTLTDTKDVKVSLSDMKIGRSSLLKASELSILNPKIMSSFKSDLKNSVSLNSLLKTDSKNDDNESDEPMKKASSLLNISPGKFNLLQRTDGDGMTHTEISKNKSKIQKEIEGVILTDVESTARRDLVRQRQSPNVLLESKVWNQNEAVNVSPPQRPERKKYIRKKNLAPSPPIYAPLPALPEQKSKSKFYLPIQEEDLPKNNSQYIRLRPWNENDTWKPKVTERVSRRSEEGTIDRRRARSVGRNTKKVPMAYRYIDIADGPKTSTFLDSLLDSPRRRRNSFDDVIQHKSTLKSVIKSNKKSQKVCEPKKVTFSAYATVQVVD